jgi:ubiquinone/menaquinone biosynthesis C-methylase UbiE
MSEVVRAFDRSARLYDDWYRESKGRHVLEAERALLDRLIPDDGMGLEIGAGTGVFAGSLTGESRTVVCLDVSEEMLTRAKRRMLPCVLGSADSLPIRRGTLDFAYMVTVVEFLQSPVKAFSESARAAKKGAPLVVLFVNRDSPWGELYGDMARKGDPIFRHAHLYTLGDMEDMARDAELSIVEAYGTLTTGPTDPAPGGEVVEPNPRAGVIAAKLTNKDIIHKQLFGKFY